MNEEKRNLEETKKYLLKLKGEDLEKGIVDLLNSKNIDLEELFLGRSNLIDKLNIYEFQNIFLNISHLFPKKLSQNIYERIFLHTFYEGNIFVKIQKIRYIKNIFIYLKTFKKINNNEFYIENFGNDVIEVIGYYNDYEFGKNIFQANFLVKIKFKNGDTNFYQCYADFGDKMRKDFIKDLADRYGDKVVKLKNGGFEFNGIPLMDKNGKLSIEDDLKVFISELF